MLPQTPSPVSFGGRGPEYTATVSVAQPTHETPTPATKESTRITRCSTPEPPSLYPPGCRVLQIRRVVLAVWSGCWAMTDSPQFAGPIVGSAGALVPPDSVLTLFLFGRGVGEPARMGCESCSLVSGLVLFLLRCLGRGFGCAVRLLEVVEFGVVWRTFSAGQCCRLSAGSQGPRRTSTSSIRGEQGAGCMGATYHPVPRTRTTAECSHLSQVSSRKPNQPRKTPQRGR